MQTCTGWRSCFSSRMRGVQNCQEEMTSKEAFLNWNDQSVRGVEPQKIDPGPFGLTVRPLKPLRIHWGLPVYLQHHGKWTMRFLNIPKPKTHGMAMSPSQKSLKPKVSGMSQGTIIMKNFSGIRTPKNWKFSGKKVPAQSTWVHKPTMKDQKDLQKLDLHRWRSR